MTQRPGGLWSKVKDAAGFVDPDAWQAAIDGRQHVGTCSECGQPLQPGAPDTVDRRGVVWYPARCIACGHEVLGRSPRPAKAGGS
jgi:hypothetical protein